MTSSNGSSGNGRSGKTDFARLLRTTLPLTAQQIGAQALRPLTQRFLPRLFAWERLPVPPSHLRRLSSRGLQLHAQRERARFEDRVQRLGGRLLEFEEAYALEAGSDGGGLPNRWTAPVAFSPFPASVRARRLAVALMLGAAESFFEDVVRAARAVTFQLEVHLLGNHVLENGIGLLCAGAIVSGIEGASFRNLGMQILNRELPKQFLPCGFHAERSISYHLHLAAALLETKMLLAHHDHALPPRLAETIERALVFATAVRAPDGTYPLFSDASLDAAPSIDDVLELAEAAGFARPPANEQKLRTFRGSGLVIASLGDFFLAFDADEDGYRQQPGHVHADALTFELWHRGERAIVDYGVSSYAVDAAREETRRTRSHNTLEFESENSSEVWSAFRTGRFSRAHLVATTERTGEVAIAAEHFGYRFLDTKPVHSRRLTLSRRGLSVVDQWTGDPRSVVSRLRMREGADLEILGTGEVTESSAVYYPRFAEANAARLFEQTATSTNKRLEWQLLSRSS